MSAPTLIALESVNDVLDDVQRRLVSWDADMCRRLGLTVSVVSHWRFGRRPVGCEAAVRIAALVDDDDVARRLVEASARERLERYRASL